MKYLVFLFLIGLRVLPCSSQSDKILDRLHFVSIKESKRLLLTEDAFTQSWSAFDIDSRMQKPGSTREELFKRIENEILPWTELEKQKLTSIVKILDALVSEKGYVLPLPDKINLVKTTMKEEGGAGAYTRADYIVFGEVVKSMEEEQLKQVFLHELFHVMSRNSPDFKEAIYKIIGFNIINDIKYPESIKELRITNPDAPQTDHYIELVHNGQPVKCMMVLYADKDYISGSFLEYLKIGFLQLEGEDEMKPVSDNGEPKIFELNEVNNYFEQIGRNTQYIIHPEEISADNFSYAILDTKDLVNPEIVEKIKVLIRLD